MPRKIAALKRGFSILELTMALAFILLFSAAILDILYQSVRGNHTVMLKQANRGAFVAFNQEMTAAARQSYSLIWDPQASILSFITYGGRVSYQIQNNNLMKNKGTGWYPVPECTHLTNLSPVLLNNPNGRLLLVVTDFQVEDETLHARCAYPIRSPNSF